MADITIPGLPAKTGTVLDASYLHLNESGVDKKMTVTQILGKISEQYSADIVSLLASADKAAGRDALAIDRRSTVSNAAYTILVTDRVVSQIGTMSTARIWTLPSASLFPGGGELLILDESGTVTSTNTISVQRAGTDTIDGATSILMSNAYGVIRLVSNGTDGWKVINPVSNKLPTIQNFTSGSGTYTTPVGVVYSTVRIIAGGGGGGGGGVGPSYGGTTLGGTGGSGGTSTFGTSLITCNGGSGGGASHAGTGGASTLGSGPKGTSSNGGEGTLGGQQSASGGRLPGGNGAYTQFGGGSKGGYNASGTNGISTTGGGGGGGGLSGSGGQGNTGGGGGAGGFVYALINSPAATYAYSVGAAGAAGTAGTDGYAGGAGGSGYIEVTEYYN